MDRLLYLYEKMYQGVPIVDEIEKDLGHMIDFWPSLYAEKRGDSI